MLINYQDKIKGNLVIYCILILEAIDVTKAFH